VERLRRVVVVFAVAVAVAACSSGPTGLGKKACPYLRPRLIRLDHARLSLPDARPLALADINAVDQDIRLYVGGNLPDNGKGKSDQALVRFSGALDRYVAAAGVAAPGPQALNDLSTTEAALAHECGV
jgi:hypothetical protein